MPDPKDTVITLEVQDSRIGLSDLLGAVPQPDEPEDEEDEADGQEVR